MSTGFYIGLIVMPLLLFAIVFAIAKALAARDQRDREHDQ